MVAARRAISRLPAQRLELAAQLAGQVVHPGQVGLHRVQLAQRLLLALAVLEDAGRLLDEGPAAPRVGVQHRVELALADDDVHLPADAGVGEQLLDVEQPAGGAVDRVLAAAVAEHGPRDGDLGVRRSAARRRCCRWSARPRRGPAAARPVVPAKMTSSILPPRSDLAPCSPMTQARASTTLDLPEPLGPTTQVIPGSKRSVVAEAKDLKPRRVRLLRCTRGPFARSCPYLADLSELYPRDRGPDRTPTGVSRVEAGGIPATRCFGGGGAGRGPRRVGNAEGTPLRASLARAAVPPRG